MAADDDDRDEEEEEEEEEEDDEELKEEVRSFFIDNGLVSDNDANDITNMLTSEQLIRIIQYQSFILTDFKSRGVSKQELLNYLTLMYNKARQGASKPSSTPTPTVIPAASAPLPKPVPSPTLTPSVAKGPLPKPVPSPAPAPSIAKVTSAPIEEEAPTIRKIPQVTSMIREGSGIKGSNASDTKVFTSPKQQESVSPSPVASKPSPVPTSSASKPTTISTSAPASKPVITAPIPSAIKTSTAVKTTSDDESKLKEDAHNFFTSNNLVDSEEATEVLQHLNILQLKLILQYKSFIVSDFKPRDATSQMLLNYFNQLQKKIGGLPNDQASNSGTAQKAGTAVESKVEPQKSKVEPEKIKVEPQKSKVEPEKAKGEPEKSKAESKIEPQKLKVEPQKPSLPQQGNAVKKEASKSMADEFKQTIIPDARQVQKTSTPASTSLTPENKKLVETIKPKGSFKTNAQPPVALQKSVNKPSPPSNPPQKEEDVQQKEEDVPWTANPKAQSKPVQRQSKLGSIARPSFATTNDKNMTEEEMRKDVRSFLLSSSFVNSDIAEEVSKVLNPTQLNLIICNKQFIIDDFQPRMVSREVLLNYLILMYKKMGGTTLPEYKPKVDEKKPLEAPKLEKKPGDREAKQTEKKAEEKLIKNEKITDKQVKQTKNDINTSNDDAIRKEVYNFFVSNIALSSVDANDIVKRLDIAQLGLINQYKSHITNNYKPNKNDNTKEKFLIYLNQLYQNTGGTVPQKTETVVEVETDAKESDSDVDIENDDEVDNKDVDIEDDNDFEDTTIDNERKSLDRLNKYLTESRYDPSVFLQPTINSIMESYGNPKIDHEQKIVDIFTELAEKLLTLTTEVQDEVKSLQHSVIASNTLIMVELENESTRLDQVKVAADDLRNNFEVASAGTLAIGEKLATIEQENKRISAAIEWMSYIESFESIPAEKYSQLHLMNSKQLYKNLPECFQGKGWGEISMILHELRKILFDINCNDVLVAQANVMKLSEAIETELLGEFEVCVTELMGDQNDKDLIERARLLTKWLHCYNNGLSLQKRYIFSVVETRIPREGLSIEQIHTPAKKRRRWLGDLGKLRVGKVKEKGVTPRKRIIKDDDDIPDDNSSGGASGGSFDEDENENNNSATNSNSKADKVDEKAEETINKERSNTVTTIDSQREVESVSSSGTRRDSTIRAKFQEKLKEMANIPKNIDNLRKAGLEEVVNAAKAGKEAIKEVGREAAKQVKEVVQDGKDAVKNAKEKVEKTIEIVADILPFDLLHQNNIPTGVVVTDHLSQLFWNISNVCQEQFSIIRKIFPPNSQARITRALTQRIFNDPTFGIHARVEAVLSPKPPTPALSLSAFLDALTTVREKLSALYIVLLDHLTQQPTQIPFTSSANDIHSLLQDTSIYKGKIMSDEVVGVEAHEREKSDREIREFLEEQISQVMGVYITDYFEKEITQVKFKFGNVLMKAVDNNKDLLAPVSVLASFPKLRTEKMKTIDMIVKTIANPQLINSIFAIVTDAIVRMETIGKDDKKLPAKAKELFMLLLTFLVDGVFFPSMITSRTLLLKHAGAKPSSSALPPMDFLKLLATIYSGVKRLKDFFENSFVRPLSGQPNLIVLCKETRRNALTELELSTRESLHAWTLSVAVHYEKVLQSVQSKYDYNPPVDPMAGIAISGLTGVQVKPKVINPSNACSTLKNEMATISDTINQFKDDLVGLNLIDAFWRPLGRQFIGGLIMHLKKQKISIDGSKVLLRDIDEYCHMTATMEAPETMDMMLSLKEIVKIYTVPGENVVKVIIEDLRQLDPTIVLALVRARTDSYARGANHWSKVLMETHGSIRSDAPLPWETKKHTTVLAFQESFSNSANIGPTTLRKSSTNLDNKKKMMNELSNAHYETEIEMDDHDLTLSSQFAPIRPDEKKILEHQYNFEIPTDLQPATISLGQRVDLIGQTPDKDKDTKKKDKVVKAAAPMMENPFAAFGDGMTKGFEKLRKTADKITSQIGDATHLKIGSQANTSTNDNHANDNIGNRKANHSHDKKEGMGLMGKLGFTIPTNPFSLSK